MDRSKVGKRSRNKGASFERQISKVFSEWLGCKVRRTPMSGAYGGEWNLGGDLMFDIEVPWYVELKNRESWRLEQLLNPEPCGPIVKWLDSTWEEASKEGKVPMVVFTRNRVGTYILLPLFHLETELGLRDAVKLPIVAFIPDGWVLTPIETFINTISRDQVLNWKTARKTFEQPKVEVRPVC